MTSIALSLLDPPSQNALPGIGQVSLLDLPVLGYGKCSQCSCPAFSGSYSTCNRSRCAHHYDQHW